MLNLKHLLLRTVNFSTWVSTYRKGLLVFIIGALIYVLAHVWLLAPPLLQRPMPIESDDGYSFTLKAEEMRSCFLQDCHALEDLEQQLLAPSDDQWISLTRFRQYHRVFIVYHPFFSAILLGVNELGFSWEQSFDLVFMAGAIFLTLSIAYWSSRLWGYGAAGVSLILISFHNFIGLGTYSTTPTTVTLGLACLTWGYVIQRKANRSLGLIIGIFLMLGMHTTGRLYSLLALGLFFLVNDERFSSKSIITILSGVALVAFTFILPLITSRPQFDFSPYDFYPGQLNFWEEVGINVEALVRFFLFWTNTYGGTLLVSVLVIAGFYYLPKERMKSNLFMAGLLIALLGATLVYIFPWFSAIATNRIWVPVAILLTGAMGHTLWYWAGNTLEKLEGFLKEPSNNARQVVVQTTIVGLGLVYIVFNAYQHGSHHFSLLQAHMITTKDYVLPDDQMQELLDSTSPSDAIVYLDEIGLYYGLNRKESYARGAVYYPAIVNSPEYDRWIEDNNELSHVFGRSPITRLDATSRGAIIISAGDRLTVTIMQPIQLSTLYLRLSTQNPGDAVRLQFSVDGQQEIIKVPGNISVNQWMAIELPEEIMLEKFTLHAIQGITLDGLRFSPETNELRWPWKTGITLSYIYQEGQGLDGKLETTLSEEGLSGFLGLPIKILSDDGSFILAEIER